MKTLYKSLMLGAVAATALVSCNKEIEAPVEQIPVRNSHVEFYAQTIDPSTKATLTTSDEATFEAAWQETDVISLYATNLDSFDETKPATWNATNGCFEAEFETAAPTEKQAWMYEAKYPYTADGNIPFGSSRIQNGNAYNSAFDVMYGTVDYDNALLGKDNDNNVFVIPMNRLTGIAYFHITGGPDEDVVSATLEATGIAAENVTIASNGASVSSTGSTLDDITITFAEGTAPKASDLQLWFNVLPGSYSGLKLTIMTATKTAVLNSKKTMTYTAGKLNKAVLSSLTWNSAAAPAGTVLFSEPFDGFAADDVPTEPGTAATIYNSANVSYTCKDGTAGTATKIWNENTGGGVAPELLVSKNGGEFAISGIPTGSNTELTVTWNSNNSYAKLYYGGESVASSEVGTKLYQSVLSVTAGTSSINLTFKNTASSNGRVDNISVVAGAPATPDQVATPTFSIEEGSYNAAQTVAISCETEGATIHYTMDGTDPTAASATYSAPITISETKTLKAIAVKDGMTASEIASATYTITVSFIWIESEITALSSSDVFVIVGNNGDTYALPHTNGSSSSPGAEHVTVSGTVLSGTVADAIKWNISGDSTNGYVFYPNGSSSTWLYCTNSNTGVRVGTNENKLFKLVDGYLFNTATSRYLGIYQSQDWRCYTSIGSNIQGQTFKFYKRVVDDGKVDANISYSPASATITYGETLTQPTLSNAHGLTVSYESSNTDVATVATDGSITVVSAGTATITCSWNEQTISGTVYRAGSATFALTVNKIAVTVAFSNPTTAVAVGSSVTNVATVTPSGLTLSYESTNTAVATVTSAGVVSGVAKGNATITATYAGDATHTSASANYQINVGSANDGSLDHPYTVEDALDIIKGYDDKQKSATQVYVTGIIANVGNYSDTYHSVTYDISDDGLTSSTLNIYSGKYVANTDFASNEDIKVGDEVIVYGYLYKYGTTSEMYQNNYIYSLNGITALPSVTPTEITNVPSDGVTGETTTVSFSNNNGWSVAAVAGDGTIVTAASLSGTTLTYTVAANSGAARTGSINITFSRSGFSSVIATISVEQNAGNSSTTENITSGTFTLEDGKLTLTLASGVTIEQSKVSGSTNVNVSYNTVSTLRVYKGHALSFSGKTFTRIEIVVNGNNYGNNLTVNSGTLTPTTSTGGTIVWEGESDNVVITNNGATSVTTQLRTTSFKVTYN